MSIHTVKTTIHTGGVKLREVPIESKLKNLSFFQGGSFESQVTPAHLSQN